MSTKESNKTLSVNKKAFHDYFIEDRCEAGLVLEGWEVKSLRAGHVQIKDSYVVFKDGEAWLLGSNISPLNSASTHVHPEAQRTRKLLLHGTEVDRLLGKVKQKGYTVVPLSLYWKKGRAKCEIALVRGKKEFDKRETIKRRDWDREKERVLKQNR